MNIKKIAFVSFLASSLYIHCAMDNSEPLRAQSGLFGQDPTANKKTVLITGGFWGDIFHPGSLMIPLREIASNNGYVLKQTFGELPSDYEYVIVFEVLSNWFHLFSRVPKDKLILFLWEPPSVIPDNYNPYYHQFFSKVFTWHDGLVDNKKYFKFFYPFLFPMIDDVIPFHQKKLATQISANKHSGHPDELYSERQRVIEFFETYHPDEFDFYGHSWPADKYSCYKGAIKNKIDVAKGYKFNFVYENIKGVPGYITEKIFDSFQAGSVPIYWGAPNIKDYIPSDCFIDRANFNSNEELYAYLKSIDEQQYSEMLAKIQRYLLSPESHLYTREHFYKTFMQLLTGIN